MSAAVEDRFGFAEMQIVSLPDLYAGKMAAALDRQHPRDLFDIHHLLENEGIDEDLFRAFLIYLASHPRPVHELLCPHKLDIAAQYDEEFVGMTVTPFISSSMIALRGRLQKQGEVIRVICDRITNHDDLLRSIGRKEFALAP